MQYIFSKQKIINRFKRFFKEVELYSDKLKSWTKFQINIK